MAGGSRPMRRPSDGRAIRSQRSRDALASLVLSDMVSRGDFQPKMCRILAEVGTYKQKVDRLFGCRRLVLTHIARTAAAQVVDAIGLEPDTRAKLSDREVRAIAWAVLAGRRLERGL